MLRCSLIENDQPARFSPAFLSKGAGGRAVHFRGTPATGGLSRGWWSDAEDVIAVMDHVGAASATIIAHSAGTRAALALAYRFSDRVRSLALITPAAAWLTGTQHDGHLVAAQRTEPEVLEALRSAETEPTDEASFQVALKIEAPLGYVTWSDVEKEHAGRGAMSLAGAQAWFSEIPGDAAERIVQMALPPTLVLSGERDILSGIEPVLAYATALGAELRSIEECGHYPWVEKPEVFLSELERWLAKSN